MSLLSDVPQVSVSPLVRRVPVAADSEGYDCCELSTAYGLRPFDWQRTALIDTMGVREDGRWAAPRGGWSVARQNGKNGGAEMFEVHVTAMLGMRVLHSAHEVKTARKAFKRLLDFFDNPRRYPELAALVKEIRRTNGQEAIELHNGGSVEFLARTKASGRGYSADILLLDEAQELTDDELEAMQPTISASQNPMLFLMGTPPRPDKPAVVWRRFRQAAVDNLDPEMFWIEYGVEPDADFAARESWARSNPGAPESISWDTIAGEFATLSPEGFAAERLGVWFPKPENIGGAIPLERWEALADRCEPQGTPSFAVATAQDRSWSAIASAWKRPDGSVQVELVDYQRGASWVTERAEAIQARYGVQVLVTNAARGLVRGAREPSQTEQAQAHNALVEAVLDFTMHHPDQAALNIAAQTCGWRPFGDTRLLDRKGTADISPIDAAALALWGCLQARDADFYVI